MEGLRNSCFCSCRKVSSLQDCHDQPIIYVDDAYIRLELCNSLQIAPAVVDDTDHTTKM